MEVHSRARKWGNSFGVIIPKKVVDEMGLKEEEDVVFQISTPGRSDVLRKSFGLGRKLKKTAQEWKDEFRRTLY